MPDGSASGRKAAAKGGGQLVDTGCQFPGAVQQSAQPVIEPGGAVDELIHGAAGQQPAAAFQLGGDRLGQQAHVAVHLAAGLVIAAEGGGHDKGEDYQEHGEGFCCTDSLCRTSENQSALRLQPGGKKSREMSECPANVMAQVHVRKGDGRGGLVGVGNGLVQGVPQGGDA